MKKSIGKIFLIAFFLVIIVGVAQQANSQRSEPEWAKDFEPYLKQAMQDWEVPGMAIAVVKDDKVIYMKGFGVREIGKKDEINVDTIFPIGSMSKAFTATAAALLVQDKKLDWDDRVIDRLPGFQMYDPWVTREITIRDLLNNRNGLGAASEMLWYATDFSRDDIVRKLRYIKPDSSFRSIFAYRNAMFLTCGQVIQAVSGMTWDDFVKSRIFKPLGMTRSSTSVQDLQGASNVTRVHLKVDGKVTAVKYRNIDNIGPAGSINASVKDMSQWLRFQLSGGSIDGKKIADPAVIEETHRAQTPVRLSPEMKALTPFTRRTDYCLGWVTVDYGEDLAVFHNGAIDGIYAYIAFIPEKQIGVVVLTNRESHHLNESLVYRVFDILLGKKTTDWNALYLASSKKQEAASIEERKKFEATRINGTKPTLPLKAYAGAYENDIFGKVMVTVEKDHLVLNLRPQMVYDLSHWHYDTFLTKNRDKIGGQRSGEFPVTFSMDVMGQISGMNIAEMLSFNKVAD